MKVSAPGNPENTPYKVPQLWNAPEPRTDTACGQPTDCLDNPNCHSHPKCDPKCKGDGCNHPDCKNDPRCNPEREEIDIPVRSIDELYIKFNLLFVRLKLNLNLNLA